LAHRFAVIDTIAAISTSFGEGAIAVLRLSGPRAIEVADAVFRARRPLRDARPREAQFGSIHDLDQKLDEVLATAFRAPASYTGEDLVEIGCHGGVLVTRRILEALLRHGARAAEPGEFTQRAFINGKLDLTQAEAVMDLISAQTDLALRAANEQLEGRLGDRIRSLRETLLDMLAHVEAYIDFPDEDIDPETGDALRARIDQAQCDVAKLLDTASQGRVLREGVRTVIYGAPNVGKSSLLNRLLGFERAIVSSRPGTTRDVIEEVINLRGIPLRLMDTAGVRESTDEIEREGIERTRRALQRADLVLHIADAHDSASSAKEHVPHNSLLVLNKSDLGEHESWHSTEAVRISCQTGEGFEPLADAIESRVFGGSAAHRDWTVAINARHQTCLERARDFLQAVHRAFDDKLSAEFIAEELRAALDAVGEVAGKADTEELLGVIFGRFCIGK
jgi:tRNA modification GTPase